MSQMRNHFENASELQLSQIPFVVITVLSGRGHIPQDPGAKAIVRKDGLHSGTIGGGKVEARAITMAKTFLTAGEETPPITLTPPTIITWNLQRDLGMTCGGEITLLFEIHVGARWQIAVFGAGHVAQALVPLLLQLECSVSNIDSRQEWLDRMPASPRLRRFHRQDLLTFVPELSKNMFVVVMTQGHATDLPILDEVMRRWPQLPYLGVMGSDVKALRMRRELLERGQTNEQVAKLHCPIGLPLGRNAPIEIAISVAAQLLQVRDASDPDLEVRMEL